MMRLREEFVRDLCALAALDTAASLLDAELYILFRSHPRKEGVVLEHYPSF